MQLLHIVETSDINTSWNIKIIFVFIIGYAKIPGWVEWANSCWFMPIEQLLMTRNLQFYFDSARELKQQSTNWHVASLETQFPDSKYTSRCSCYFIMRDKLKNSRYTFHSFSFDPIEHGNDYLPRSVRARYYTVNWLFEWKYPVIMQFEPSSFHYRAQ